MPSNSAAMPSLPPSPETHTQHPDHSCKMSLLPPYSLAKALGPTPSLPPSLSPSALSATMFPCRSPPLLQGYHPRLGPPPSAVSPSPSPHPPCSFPLSRVSSPPHLTPPPLGPFPPPYTLCHNSLLGVPSPPSRVPGPPSPLLHCLPSPPPRGLLLPPPCHVSPCSAYRQPPPPPSPPLPPPPSLPLPLPLPLSRVKLLLIVQAVSHRVLQVCRHCEHHKLMCLDDGRQ